MEHSAITIRYPAPATNQFSANPRPIHNRQANTRMRRREMELGWQVAAHRRTQALKSFDRYQHAVNR